MAMTMIVSLHTFEAALRVVDCIRRVKGRKNAEDVERVNEILKDFERTRSWQNLEDVQWLGRRLRGIFSVNLMNKEVFENGGKT